MKVKTNELTDIALDWAVAKIKGLDFRIKESDDLTKHIVTSHPIPCPDNHPGCCVAHFKSEYYSPSTDRLMAGAIIEKCGICIISPTGDETDWIARSIPINSRIWVEEYGSTPLIAAMRCFCASKLGDEIDIPEELCK